MHILIGFLAALLVFSLIKYGIKSDPKQRRKLVYIVAVGLAAAVLLLLLLTGRIHFLAAIVAAAIPFAKKLPLLLRYIPMFRYLTQRFKRPNPSGAERVSTVTTSLLAMSLDQQTGNVDGVVLLGELKGRPLTDLSLPQLFQLYQIALSQYADAVPVFDAFLQRHIAPDWRNKATEFGFQFEELNVPAHNSEIDVAQALQILGLAEGATKDQILDAHRKLMQKLHPDRGGSNFLAAQVNMAKDVLLEKLDV